MPSDPGTLFLMILAAGVVLTGFYYFMREIIADAIDLHEKRKEQHRDHERRNRP